MDPRRFVVSDVKWSRLEGLFPGKATDRGVTAADTRMFLEAVFWRVRTGMPWRDLPSGFGNWNSDVSAADMQPEVARHLGGD